MFVTRAKYNRERVRAFELGRADGVRAAVAGIEMIIASGTLDEKEAKLAEYFVERLTAGVKMFEDRAPAGESVVVTSSLPSIP